MIVDRKFSDLGRVPEQDPQPARALFSFLEKKALVVLGDPGAGKTTSFKQAAQDDTASIYVTVSDFLTLQIKRYQNKTLFLDALDEMRGRANDGRTALDQLRSRLDELGCPPFRLSCRAADWYGSSDAHKLSDVSPDRTLTVLKIEPLGEREIGQIVSDRGIDYKRFLEEARSRDVYPLLENPQTLLMLLDVVGQGQWPDSRAELFRRAVEVLVSEINDEHRRSSRTMIAPVDLIKTAGHLSAILLCGGAEGVALDDNVANGSYISIQTFGWPIEQLTETAHRRLFRTQGLERVMPVHRTVAEYLAAKYLSERINAGLPLKRVLSLITGHDGGTLSDLRGLFAWLACLSPQYADTLTPIDPLGIVLYGDAALFPPAVKHLLIKCLVAAARENPWLRSDALASRPFGALSSQEMEPVFRAILEDREEHPISVSFVVDAIQHGYPLPRLGNLLLSLARDESKPDFLREGALKAFGRICKDRITDLLALLADIHNGGVQDLNCELRAFLLRSLYPKIIGPTEIAQYIIQEPKSYVGDYSRYVGYELCRATRQSDIPDLLDTIAANKVEFNSIQRHSYRKFIGQLLIDGLVHHSEHASPARLYNWLGVALDRYQMNRLDDEQRRAVREWLQANPEIVKRVFEHWLSITSIDKLKSGKTLLWERIQRVEYPEGFAQWLLDLAVAQEHVDMANFLFREGVQLRTIFNRDDAPTLDELFQLVAKNPRFQETWRKELFCEIEKWRWENIQRDAEHRKERETFRLRNIGQIMEHLDEVRAGTHIKSMIFYAQVYFGLCSNIDRGLEPRERILSITNHECTEAILEGLVAGLRRENPEVRTPEMIAEINVKSRRYNYGFAVLAGMDILSQRSIDDALSLPENVLESALAYHYAMGEGEERKWVSDLLQKRVDTAVKVLETFWGIHLAHKSEHISGLYALARNEEMALVAQKVTLPILRAYPNCKENHLKGMLWAALLFVDRNELQSLTNNILKSNNAVKGVQRTLWYGAAFMLNPIEFGKKLRKYIGANRKKAETLLAFLYPSWPRERHLKIPELSVSILQMLVLICGKIFLNETQEATGNDEESEYQDHSGTLRDLINRIASFPDEEATQVLHNLYEQRSLVSMREFLSHALDVQTRKRREAMFKYPSVDQVVNTINGSRPANPADLQALVIDYLLQLRDDISRGPTDGYKTYWNVDSHGRPSSPCPEETCRDRLLEKLKFQLAPYGLAAEPEGHYARDKRADIKVLFGSTLNLPVEIKRHHHPKLWTAPKDQLQRLYAQDPGSGGRGIYLVFWFGIAEGRRIPPPPTRIKMPSTPNQLETALQQAFPAKDRALIEFIVMDCSGQ